MSTPETCENCQFSQWTSAALMCTNKQSDEHLMFVLGIDGCNEFERYAGADFETERAGAIE